MLIGAQSAGGPANIEEFEGDCKNQQEMPIRVYLVFYFAYLSDVLISEEDHHNTNDGSYIVQRLD